MRFFRSAATLIALALAAASPPAMAQSAEIAPTPDAWSVFPDPERAVVRISKTAIDGTTFVGGCDKSFGPGFSGIFTRYGGGGLRTDGAIERVLFAVSGDGWKEMFSAQLRYTQRSGGWEIAKVLAPVFVSSFSRGSKLTVLNSKWQEVATFDLTGSSAAARTMRSICGFQ